MQEDRRPAASLPGESKTGVPSPVVNAGGASDRLARLTQQKQRLLEQKARLAAAKSASQLNVTPAPTPSSALAHANGAATHARSASASSQAGLKAPIDLLRGVNGAVDSSFGPKSTGQRQLAPKSSPAPTSQTSLPQKFQHVDLNARAPTSLAQPAARQETQPAAPALWPASRAGDAATHLASKPQFTSQDDDGSNFFDDDTPGLDEGSASTLETPPTAAHPDQLSQEQNRNYDRGISQWQESKDPGQATPPTVPQVSAAMSADNDNDDDGTDFFASTPPAQDLRSDTDFNAGPSNLQEEGGGSRHFTASSEHAQGHEPAAKDAIYQEGAQGAAFFDEHQNQELDYGATPQQTLEQQQADLTGPPQYTEHTTEPFQPTASSQPADHGAYTTDQAWNNGGHHETWNNGGYQETGGNNQETGGNTWGYQAAPAGSTPGQPGWQSQHYASSTDAYQPSTSGWESDVNHASEASHGYQYGSEQGEEASHLPHDAAAWGQPGGASGGEAWPAGPGPGAQAGAAWGGSTWNAGPSSGQPARHPESWHTTPFQQFQMSAPVTAEEALRSSAGRPPVPLIAFGFGGRVVSMQPKAAPLMSSSAASPLAVGPLELHKMDNLAQTLQGCQGDAMHDRNSEESMHALLSGFPSIAAASSKDKVLQYIVQQEEKCRQRQEEDDALFWGLLRILAQNHGSLHPVTNGKDKHSKAPLGKQLGELLNPGTSPATNSGLEAVDLAQPSSLSSQGLPDARTAQAACLEMQDRLQEGDCQQALRVATGAALWGPALMIARLLGEGAVQETAAKMSAGLLQPGTPLQTFFSALAHASQPPGAGVGEREWRSSLALLASNYNPATEAGLLQLGDRLWAQPPHQAAAAQLCYIAAGCEPLPHHAAARLCLAGADHRSQPRTYASPAAIQKALLLDFVRSQGQHYSRNAAAVMIPYRVVLASTMAEYGLVELASQHAAVAAAALNAMGGKLPAGLVTARILANELQMRLQRHAQAFRIQLARPLDGSLVRKASKWLDRGLSKLIGIAEIPDQPPAEADSLPPRPQHRRANSLTDLYKGSPAQRRVSSAMEMSQGPPSRPGTPQNLHIPSPSSSIASSPVRMGHMRAASDAGSVASSTTGEKPGSAEKANGVSVRGIMSKVGSLTSLLGPPSLGKKDADLGSENKLYYDNELKCWREAGKPAPQAPAPVGPPPTRQATPPPNHTANPSASGNEGPELSNGGPATSQPTFQGHKPPQSRYVDTLSSGRQASGSLGTFRPPNAAGGPPGFKPPAPGRPAGQNFFVPGGGSGGQNASQGSPWAVNKPVSQRGFQQ